MLFINAWNEWCEGMILEPTINNKYKYLEWIKDVYKRQLHSHHSQHELCQHHTASCKKRHGHTRRAGRTVSYTHLLGIKDA